MSDDTTDKTDEPITILVTDEYFPTFEDTCGPGGEIYIPDQPYTNYETSYDEAGNITVTLTATDGAILLVEGGAATFNHPAFSDEECVEETPPPFVSPGDQIGGTLPATGPDGVGLLILLACGLLVAGFLAAYTQWRRGRRRA